MNLIERLANLMGMTNSSEANKEGTEDISAFKQTDNELFYEKNKKNIWADNKDKYALIFEEKVYGSYDTYMEALKKATRLKLGIGSYLIRYCSENKPKVDFEALNITANDICERIKNEHEWVKNNYDAIKEKYDGKFVLCSSREIIFCSDTFVDCMRKAFDMKLRYGSYLIEKIDAG